MLRSTGSPTYPLLRKRTESFCPLIILQMTINIHRSLDALVAKDARDDHHLNTVRKKTSGVGDIPGDITSDITGYVGQDRLGEDDTF